MPRLLGSCTYCQRKISDQHLDEDEDLCETQSFNAKRATNYFFFSPGTVL